jgi:hypothetical protein
LCSKIRLQLLWLLQEHANFNNVILTNFHVTILTTHCHLYKGILVGVYYRKNVDNGDIKNRGADMLRNKGPEGSPIILKTCKSMW